MLGPHVDVAEARHAAKVTLDRTRLQLLLVRFSNVTSEIQSPLGQPKRWTVASSSVTGKQAKHPLCPAGRLRKTHVAVVVVGPSQRDG